MSISGLCSQCGTERYSLHRDHIKPKFEGGTNDHENIQLLCANCHEDKTRGEMRRRGIPPQAVAGAKAHNTGRPLSPEHAAKIVPWGRKKSESEIAGIKERMTGNTLAKGKPFTAEHRANLSASIKAAHARRKGLSFQASE